MAYRKLVVDGKNYEFVIGKVNTKVRDDSGKSTIYNNSDIGSPLGYKYYEKGELIQGYVVTPLNVSRAVLGLGIPEFVCERDGVKTTKLIPDPFESEIGQRTRYMMNCPYCEDRLAGDI